MSALARPEALQTQALLGPRALLHVYRNRLRAHAIQELLAGLVVAIAVALVFATLVANASITGSAREVVHTVIGPANLQLRARGNDGFDEHLLARVRELPGVHRAAPLLEQIGTISSRDGRHAIVEVVGADVSLAQLDGLLHTLPLSLFARLKIGLSTTSAAQLGIPSEQPEGEEASVSLRLRGAATALKVSAVLGPGTFGALSRALVAVMPLASLQRIASLRGRVSRIFIQTLPGREQQVRDGLNELTGGRITVAPADQDIGLLRQALRPSGQASGLFAVISALLGFLFAFNAILLTIPERRQAIADLRVDGARRSAIVEMILFQGLLLGLCASLIGLLGGYVLSTEVFKVSPGYLSQAFTLGTSTVIEARWVLLSLACGVLATCLATTVLLLDLRPGRALDAVYHEDGVPGNTLDGDTARRLGLLALLLLALASMLAVLAPSAAILACVALALACVLAIPFLLASVLEIMGAFARRYSQFTLLPVALTSLRATTIRSLALTATGAVALFGSVALGGAQHDLLRGLHNFAGAYAADGEVWVLNPGYTPETTSFPADGYAQRIGRLEGVSQVHLLQSEFEDMGKRRVVILARPPGSGEELLRHELVAGNLTSTLRRLREGGWVTASKQVAEEQHVQIGGTLLLLTPTGTARFRLAALTTNFGWPGGSLVISSADFSRRWATHEPTALAVDFKAGTNIEVARRAVAASLGASTGLEAITARSWRERFDTLAGEGLSQLSETSTLLVLAAILAMAAALGSGIWQRRRSLADLHLEGAAPSRLRRVLLIEATLMLGTGCVVGALAGIYGQVVIDSYLRSVTGFPVASFTTSTQPLEIFVLVVVAVLAIAAVPTWIASRVSPTLALDE